MFNHLEKSPNFHKYKAYLTAPDLVDRLYKLLAETCRVLREHKIKYWAVAGTVLGAIRHGGMIPWDDDLDLAIPKRDVNKLLSKSFRARLSRNNLQLVPPRLSYRRTLLHKNTKRRFALYKIYDKSVPRGRTWRKVPEPFVDIFVAVTEKAPRQPRHRTRRRGLASGKRRVFLTVASTKYVHRPMKRLKGHVWRKEDFPCKQIAFGPATPSVPRPTLPVPRHARRYLRNAYSPSWNKEALIISTGLHFRHGVYAGQPRQKIRFPLHAIDRQPALPLVF
jgi:hypothetical protein